jgi:xylulokinase
MFIGIDVGTSEVKALLLSDSHAVVGSAGAALTIQRPHPGHSEQHPDDWWTATCAALASLQNQFPREYAAVRAMGLSGQMHGAVLLDQNDQVLRPAILWNDTRSALECDEMMAELSSLPALGGSLAMPGFTAPKLRWVAKHEPDVFKRIAKVLLPKDYIRMKLIGDYVTDMSDASGTLWLDVSKRRWSPELLSLCRLSEQQMPRAMEGSQASGMLRPDTAKQLKLNPKTVVAGGAGDNAASAIGMGLTNAGQGFLSLGTSGVLFVVTPSYQPNAASATHAFCHALPGTWHQMSVMLSAASCLNWVKALVSAHSEAALASQASQLSQAQRTNAPLFLPYLSGERTPHNNANLRGSFHGLSFDTDTASLAYSVMEGVSFGLCDGLAALRTAGSDVKRLALVGGGSRSAFWAQQLASALNIEIEVYSGAALGGALGAARLGWLASLDKPSSTAVDAATLRHVCPTPDVEFRYLPQQQEQDFLWKRLEKFRSLHQQSFRQAI